MGSDAIRARFAGARRSGARGDKWLRLLVLLMLAGYAFFFLSRFFFPKVYKSTDVTPIGTSVTLGDYTLTLDAWDWAPRQRTMEILFDLTNVSLDRVPQISFICRSGAQIYPSEIYRATAELLVVRVRGVSERWTQASLTVKAEGSNARLYMDDRSVTQVEALADRTDRDYAVYAAQSKISAAQAELDVIAGEKATKTADIEYTYQQLAALTEKKAAQTAAEQAQTERGIRTLADTQARLENELEELALRENELKEKIEVQQRVLQELGGDGT